MFGAPSIPELLIIGVIVLLLFGKRLPGVMNSLGKSIVEFKRGVKAGEDEESQEKIEQADRSAAPKA
jgi:sec-independent protein translocase protein TatA